MYALYWNILFLLLSYYLGYTNWVLILFFSLNRFVILKYFYAKICKYCYRSANILSNENATEKDWVGRNLYTKWVEKYTDVNLFK